MDNNLTTNLQTIKTAFEDIKSALNSKGANIIDCTPVTEYAQAINDLPSDVFSGTFIVFKQSETTPDIPEGGSWNGSSFEYPYGWGPTQKSRLVGPVWMSYAIITQDTSDSIIWSTPVKISGEAGDSSQIGVVTIDGILYWTLNGELIYDENGNPVKAEGVDGKNANTAFTATVFTRSDDPPTKPIGGDYFDPKPTSNDGVTWYDAIPPGTGFPWMSSRIFSSNGLYPQEAEWSTPTYAADSADLDFAFSSNATQPEPPISHGNHSEDPNWYNDGDEHSIWMAVSKMRNNEWGQWKITKIKGEQGPIGESSTIKGYFDSENDLRIAYDKYLAGLVTESGFKLPLTVGNGYLVDGNLWIFDGSGESFEDDWINVGSIKGEPGQSQYFYVGYKNNLDDPNEEVMINGRVGKYIGTKLSSVEISPDDLKKLTTYDNWTQWTGDDGWGWEQVFMATSVSTPPHILDTEKSLSEAELIDKGWSDKPISVSDKNKYIWYLFRKSTGSWKGESEAEGVIYAALYDRWTYDACTFKLSDHQIIVPVEDDGSVDSDWYSENQSELLNLHLYKGDQEIPYSEITFGFESDPVDNDLVEILDGVAHINRRSLNNISKIKFTATYKGVVYEDVCHIITDKHGYELRVNTPILVVNSDSRTVNPATVKASLTKWNGTSFVPVSGKTLLFTVNDMNGGSSTTGHTTDESGWALLTSTYNNVKNIRVQYQGETVTLEQYVDCVTNGSPGDKGEPGKGISGIIKYYRANNSPTTPPTLDEEDKWKLDITKAGLSSTNRYLWCWELISFTDASTKSSIYLIAVEGEPGASGTGKDAPMIYPAGIWRDDITYTSTDSKLPYVYYATNSKYYTLLPNKTTPVNTPPTNKSYWEELESYDAIYANIGIFNQALVGAWVFHGDYMFSQQGTGYRKDNHSPFSTYDWFDNPAQAIANYLNYNASAPSSDYEWFRPNAFFNAKTGVGQLGNVTVSSLDTNMSNSSNKIIIKDNFIKIVNSESENSTIISNELNSWKGKPLCIPQMSISQSATLNGNTSTSDSLSYNICDISRYIGSSSEPFRITFAAGSLVASTSTNNIHWTITSYHAQCIFDIKKPNGKSETIVKDLANTSGNIHGEWIGNDIKISWNNTYIDLPAGDIKIRVIIGIKAQAVGVAIVPLTIAPLSFIMTYSNQSSLWNINNVAIGADAVYVNSDKGFSKMSDENFIALYGYFGIKVDSSGIYFTKDSGNSWIPQT